MKVCKITVFITQYSIFERPSSLKQCSHHPVHAFHAGDFIFHDSHITKVHKFNVFMAQCINIERPSSIKMLCFHLSVCGFHDHDLIFPPGLILWKYTRSRCLWHISTLMKDKVPSASYIMFASCSTCLLRVWSHFSHWVSVLMFVLVNYYFFCFNSETSFRYIMLWLYFLLYTESVLCHIRI